MKDNSKPKMSKKKIRNIVLISLIVVATIGFAAMMPTIFDPPSKKVEDMLIVFMFLDFFVWIGSFFGLLICLYLDQMQKRNPELYAKLFPAKEKNGSAANEGEAPKGIFKKIGHFFKRIWNNPLIMVIIAVVLLLGLTALSSVLEVQVVYLVLETFAIIIALIIAGCRNWRGFAKILLIAILIAALITMISLLFSNSGGGSGYDPDECVSCHGAGMVNDGFLDFNTCPTCKGSGRAPH